MAKQRHGPIQLRSILPKTIRVKKDIYGNGTHIRRELRNRCAHKEESLLFDLFKAFD